MAVRVEIGNDSGRYKHLFVFEDVADGAALLKLLGKATQIEVRQQLLLGLNDDGSDRTGTVFVETDHKCTFVHMPEAFEILTQADYKEHEESAQRARKQREMANASKFVVVLERGEKDCRFLTLLDESRCAQTWTRDRATMFSTAEAAHEAARQYNAVQGQVTGYRVEAGYIEA